MHIPWIFICSTILATVPLVADGARILGLMTTPSPSHHIWNRVLMLELAKRGHHVTVLSPDVETTELPTYRHILLENVYEEIHKLFKAEEMPDLGLYQSTVQFFKLGQAGCEIALKTKGVEQLTELTRNETFDLIFIEVVLQECFNAFIPLFGSPPTIAVTAYASPPWAYSMVENPLNPSYVNSYQLPYTDHMSFCERFSNFLLHTFVHHYRTHFHLPEMDRIARQYIDPSTPDMWDLERNVTAVFVNIDSRLDFPRPFVPAMIPVAGLHIKPPQALPKDIQEFLDGAKDGAILFSLGSNVRSDKLTAEKRAAFLGAFREIPQRILWKWESDTLPGQPHNVKISKWLPQNDILAHPQIRVFITHAGLLSTQEASYHGVPVVGVPFMADQYINIHKTVNRGMGVLLDFRTLSKHNVLQALNSVLHNPQYRNRAQEASRIFRDQQQTPLERAVYWTEYVLRHNGARHLRSAALDLAWYQVWMLDILLALLLTLALLAGALFILVRAIAQLCRTTKERTDKKNK